MCIYVYIYIYIYIYLSMRYKRARIFAGDGESMGLMQSQFAQSARSETLIAHVRNSRYNDASILKITPTHLQIRLLRANAGRKSSNNGSRV
jgi:hypothetical protein